MQAIFRRQIERLISRGSGFVKLLLERLHNHQLLSTKTFLIPKQDKSSLPRKSPNLVLENSCENLCERFYALQNSRDIADLLVIQYEYLTYRLYKIPRADQYKVFEIPKKTGGNRTILAPSSTLKILQRKLSQVLYCVYKAKPSVHGYVPRKSIVTNAHAHAHKRYVLNVDLENFFPSINFGRVRGMFMSRPYNLNPEVSTVLAQICCHNNQLPQGAPTSPIISNMICAKMDGQLQRLAKKFSCTYTRYADDITFSTTLPKFPEQLASVISEEQKEKIVIGEALSSIIKDNGFSLNNRKIRLQNSKSHQEVTGLTVNKFPNVSRHYVRQIRAMLHSWEKFGLYRAERHYEMKYLAKKSQLPEKNSPSFKEVVLGKILFLQMVRGKNDSLYKKYINKYRCLAKRDC